MVGDPVQCILRYGLQGPGFLEQVGRSLYDTKLVLTAHPCLGLPVHVEDCRVVLPDDKKTGCLEEAKGLSCHIGTPTPGDNRTDPGTGPRRGLNSRRGACARAEQVYTRARHRLLSRNPFKNVVGPFGKERYIESVFTTTIFFFGKEVEEKAPDPCVLELFGDKVVANAVPTRPASVDEYDEPPRLRGDPHMALEGHLSCCYLNHDSLPLRGYRGSDVQSMIRLV